MAEVTSSFILSPSCTNEYWHQMSEAGNTGVQAMTASRDGLCLDMREQVFATLSLLEPGQVQQAQG